MIWFCFLAAAPYVLLLASLDLCCCCMLLGLHDGVVASVADVAAGF